MDKTVATVVLIGLFLMAGLVFSSDSADAKPKPTIAQRVASLEKRVTMSEASAKTIAVVLKDAMKRDREHWLKFLAKNRIEWESQMSLNRALTDRLVQLSQRLDQLDRKPQGD